jgi:hypothetical protein
MAVEPQGGRGNERGAQQRLAVRHELVQGALGASEAAALLGCPSGRSGDCWPRIGGQGQGATSMGILGAGRPTGSQRRGASGWSRAQPTDHGCNYQQLSELLAERESLALARSSVRRILLDAGIATPRG